MAFESYLTFDEYINLGGKVSEDAFPNLERKCQRWLDSLTFNRIPHCTVIPDVVKEVLTEWVNRIYEYESISSSEEGKLESYSNGVETIKYKDKSEVKFKKELFNLAVEWLPEYLVCRSVSFDVDEYLQSENNNS